ncbi:MAG: class I SAM-dependent methyltransferase [bacterium]
MKIINRDKYEEKYKNVFLKKSRDNASLWWFYQILFKLWVIHAKVTKRDFFLTAKNLENVIGKTKISGDLIDIGGGSGWMSKYWRAGGLYTVLDPLFRKDILKTSSYKKNQLIFIQDSAEQIPFGDNEFEWGFLCATIDHVKNPQKVIAETSRVLKRSGHLFISHKIDHNDKKYSLGHISPLSETKLKKLLEQYFIIEKELKSPDKEVVYIWLKNNK